MKRTLIFLLIIMLLLSGCNEADNPDITQAGSTANIQSTPPETQTAPSEENTTAPSTDTFETEPAATEPSFVPVETEPPTTEPTVALTAPETVLLSMTVEEKVGQLFLARCPDIQAAQDVANYHLGGYVLFGRDFESKSSDEVITNIQSYQDAAKIPMLIAVDEEGGIVCRVSAQSQFRESRFLSPRKLYEQGGLELILTTETEKIQLLSSLGINVNLAPVCDVTTDPNAFMYSRSLGQSPETTGTFIAEVVSLMDQYGFGGVLKHFPGYGNNTDTHVGIAVDDRSLEELESVDLVPFTMGIEAGADAIMVSHTFVNCLDSELPASLSPKVINYLRNEMGFTGVVVTDDLVMEAITDLYGAGESAVLAVLAGCDMLCSSEYQVQYQAVLEAVESGRISTEMLDAAVLRILNWKQQLGLLES